MASIEAGVARGAVSPNVQLNVAEIDVVVQRFERRQL